MEFIQQLIDFILHIDKHLIEIVQDYELWTYAILFLIIFAETGFVVTPFLPGDSLLFAAGAIIAKPESGLNIGIMCVLLIIAAILGDLVNYHIGDYIGPKAFSGRYKLLKKEYLERTQKFYEKHGGKTIIYARFIPIIRTFAPFIAGVGTMSYARFASYSWATSSGGCRSSRTTSPMSSSGSLSCRFCRRCSSMPSTGFKRPDRAGENDRMISDQ